MRPTDLQNPTLDDLADLLTDLLTDQLTNLIPHHNPLSYLPPHPSYPYLMSSEATRWHYKSSRDPLRPLVGPLIFRRAPTTEIIDPRPQITQIIDPRLNINTAMGPPTISYWQNKSSNSSAQSDCECGWIVNVSRSSSIFPISISYSFLLFLSGWSGSQEMNRGCYSWHERPSTRPVPWVQD